MSAIELEIRDGVALIALNRPERLNAITVAMVGELSDALVECNGRDDVRVAVLTGRGRAFCAGVDLKEAARSKNVFAADGMGLGLDAPIVRCFRAFAKPLIGAVNGVAATGGFELALACDFLLAAESARFADTHAFVGLLPGWGLSQKLPRLIGVGRAKELSFSGRFVESDEAYRIGLVNQVYPDSELLDASLALAARIGGADADVLPQVKRLIDHGWENSLHDGLAHEGQEAIAWNGRVDMGAMEARLAAVRKAARRAD